MKMIKTRSSGKPFPVPRTSKGGTPKGVPQHTTHSGKSKKK